MELEKHVLPEDTKMAQIYILAAEYYTKQADYCVSRFNFEAAEWWINEHRKVINDMKQLRLKKLNSERTSIDAKL